MSSKTNNETETRQPKAIAYYVVEKNGNNYWNRIGASFSHDDGKGETVILDMLPVNFNGEIVLRKPKAKPAAE